MARLAGCDPEWILSVSGIRERRYAAAEEGVAELALRAAQDCLQRAGVEAAAVGMLLLASGSSERRFPGPAATVAQRLGLGTVPAIDLPMASVGALFGLALAAQLAPIYKLVLVVAAEKMSAVVAQPPLDPNIAVLFGDGAGACLVSHEDGLAEVLDAALYSDGTFSEDLRLEFQAPLAMNGRVVILQASRKIPSAVLALLERQAIVPSQVGGFIMHQANQNLIVRVARALGVPDEAFYVNIDRYGNTSSASLLIAAAEWVEARGFRPAEPVIMTAFGAGFHWGALLARGC